MAIRYIQSIMNVMGDYKSPPDFIFFVTSACNARCEFCHFVKQLDTPERRSIQLTIDEIDRISQQYGRLSKLSLCGGEPFIRKDISQIVQSFVDHCGVCIVDIPTNGSLPGSITKQTEAILNNNPKLVLEIQFSIDGPRKVHDYLRGFPGLYNKCLQSIESLLSVRKKYPNLRLKLNCVFQSGNADMTLDLAKTFEKYDFDRFQITFPHGDEDLQSKIKELSFEEFKKISRHILLNMKVHKYSDLHSLLFRAIKVIRDEVLDTVMAETDMGNICDAGKRIVVLDDIGEVYPCEPLWKSVGNIRKHDYSIHKVLAGAAMQSFKDQHIGPHKCHCTWGCVALDQIIFNPQYYPRILFYLMYLYCIGGRGLNKREFKS